MHFKQEYRRNLSQATHCSLNFLTVFIAFNTAQNIQSEALENDGFGKLGFWAVAILYLFIAVGSVFSTVILNKIGEVKCMAVGSFVNTPWILSFALCSLDHGGILMNKQVITAVILLLSMLNGIGQAIQWVGQGKYMSDCATDTTKGFFMSYFWAFYMSSPIFGNLIAAYCIRRMSQAMLFVVMAVISLVAAVSALFLRQPEKRVEEDRVEIRGKEEMSTLGEEDSKDRGKQPTRIMEEIRSLAFLTCSTRMRRLFPQLFWTGISIAFYASCLTPMLSRTLTSLPEEIRLYKSMQAMVVFGVGEIVGCIGAG